jgi:chromosome segregation ATPase
VDRPDKPSALAEAALALDRELRRFEDLAAQAARLKLSSEKNLERATEALTRAAESQDRIRAHVQELVAAVAATRERQESDAANLMERAQEIAGRRKEFSEVLERMAGLGRMAKEIQEALKGGPSAAEGIGARMQQISDEAAAIVRTAEEKEMEDVARQAEVLRQQILGAKNKIALLTPKARA